MKEKKRCEWAEDNTLLADYHDKEWGDLSGFQDDDYLFEMLTLEGAQAGLSWLTILKRREAYREAFQEFRPEIVAAFTYEDVERLKQNTGIIRNERKIKAAIKNAAAVIDIERQFGSFHQYLWNFAGEKQQINHWETHQEVPASNGLSEDLSKDLKRRGFSFVGPVICYSFLQAIGLVVDHTAQCFKRKEGDAG